MEKDIDVNFMDEDRVTILDTQRVAKGDKVVYKGKIPSKEPVEGVTYSFAGWENEERMDCVVEKLVLVAKYESSSSLKDAMYNASLENAQKANLKDVMASGNKINEQQKALEKDSRSAEEIVNDIVENGKTEVGQEINKDNMER